MKLILITLMAGYLLLMTGCGRPTFDPVHYRQEQRIQRVFLQEEVRALEYPQNY